MEIITVHIKVLVISDLAYARVTAAVTAAQEITEAYHLLINYSSALYCNLDGEMK